MITIRVNIQNKILVPIECLTLDTNVRLRFERQSPVVNKTTIPTSVLTYAKYYMFIITEVPTVSENLPIGHINLSDQRGEWKMYVDTSPDGLVWTTVYSEICKVPR